MLLIHELMLSYSLRRLKGFLKFFVSVQSIIAFYSDESLNSSAHTLEKEQK